LDVADCEQIGFSASEALELGLRQSVAFANFVNVTEETTEGRIRFVIVSQGNAQPAVPYPPLVAGVSAGCWTAASRPTQRVEIPLLPAGWACQRGGTARGVDRRSAATTGAFRRIRRARCARGSASCPRPPRPRRRRSPRRSRCP